MSVNFRSLQCKLYVHHFSDVIGWMGCLYCLHRLPRVLKTMDDGRADPERLPYRYNPKSRILNLVFVCYPICLGEVLNERYQIEHGLGPETLRHNQSVNANAITKVSSECPVSRLSLLSSRSRTPQPASRFTGISTSHQF